MVLILAFLLAGHSFPTPMRVKALSRGVLRQAATSRFSRLFPPCGLPAFLAPFLRSTKSQPPEGCFLRPTAFQALLFRFLAPLPGKVYDPLPLSSFFLPWKTSRSDFRPVLSLNFAPRS